MSLSCSPQNTAQQCRTSWCWYPSRAVCNNHWQYTHARTKFHQKDTPNFFCNNFFLRDQFSLQKLLPTTQIWNHKTMEETRQDLQQRSCNFCAVNCFQDCAVFGLDSLDIFYSSQYIQWNWVAPLLTICEQWRCLQKKKKKHFRTRISICNMSTQKLLAQTVW